MTLLIILNDCLDDQVRVTLSLEWCSSKHAIETVDQDYHVGSRSHNRSSKRQSFGSTVFLKRIGTTKRRHEKPMYLVLQLIQEDVFHEFIEKPAEALPTAAAQVAVRFARCFGR